MTIIYFIRHAQADNAFRDDRTRSLTEKGMSDRSLVTEFLSDKNINAVLSSPYKRAVDTVSDFANSVDLDIVTVEDFRERKIDSNRVEDFEGFVKNQWADFSYKLSGGECLSEVQKRNVTALRKVLTEYKDKNIVIGTHGTALSTIINYYDQTYGFEDFMAMVFMTPWVVKMMFYGDKFVEMEKIDLLHLR